MFARAFPFAKRLIFRYWKCFPFANPLIFSRFSQRKCAVDVASTARGERLSVSVPNKKAPRPQVGGEADWVTGGMSHERRLGTETPCDRGAVKAIESVHDTGTPSMADGLCGSSALCYFYLCGLPHPALGFKVTLQDFRLKGYFSTTADSYRTCKLPAFVFRCDLDHLPDPDGYVNRCFLF